MIATQTRVWQENQHRGEQKPVITTVSENGVSTQSESANPAPVELQDSLLRLAVAEYGQSASSQSNINTHNNALGSTSDQNQGQSISRGGTPLITRLVLERHRNDSISQTLNQPSSTSHPPPSGPPRQSTTRSNMLPVPEPHNHSTQSEKSSHQMSLCHRAESSQDSSNAARSVFSHSPFGFRDSVDSSATNQFDEHDCETQEKPQQVGGRFTQPYDFSVHIPPSPGPHENVNMFHTHSPPWATLESSLHHGTAGGHAQAWYMATSRYGLENYGGMAPNEAQLLTSLWDSHHAYRVDDPAYYQLPMQAIPFAFSNTHGHHGMQEQMA